MHSTPDIQVLPPHIANQIAAGEVVERPASVLKELLENSLDAGATQIEVTLEQGGLTLIQVQDNGRGISEASLPRALSQHATSKISSIEDVMALQSLGFRGEALASIAAVSELTLISKVATAQAAWQVTSVAPTALQPAAHPTGTTVSVRDLFSPVPVRRKFLKSPRTEMFHLEDVFNRVALSRMEVGFKLRVNNKLVKSLPACQDEPSRLRRLAKICGKAQVDHVLALDYCQNGMQLQGWVASPDRLKAQEERQYFFLNQRVIRDRLINHAIRTAYAEMCGPERQPWYCLFLSLDPSLVDVNVHPTKHEVRFQQARIVHALITDAILATLGALPTASTPPAPKPTADNVSPSAPNKASPKLTTQNVASAANNPKLIQKSQQPTTVTRDAPPQNWQPYLAAKQAPLAAVKLHVQMADKLWLVQYEQDYFWLNPQQTAQSVLQYQLRALWQAQRRIPMQALPTPISLSMNLDLDVEAWRVALVQCGFEISPLGAGVVALRQQPSLLDGYRVAYQPLLVAMARAWQQQQPLEQLIELVGAHAGVTVSSMASALMAWLQRLPWSQVQAGDIKGVKQIAIEGIVNEIKG